MKYLDIKCPDVANGIGIRVSLFCSGCDYHCKGCFNPESWDFNAGKDFTQEEIEIILNHLGKSYINGITLLGGEPLHHKNRKEILNLIRIIKEKYPTKNIWCYTGNTFENFIEENDPIIIEIFNNLDVLVDGPFIEDLKNLSIKFRGSSNQRILNMKESMKELKPIKLES